MERFDVVIVGAGTGGCTAAKTAASAGLNVCLIDCKSEREIGNKVCGDAIGRHHFDTLGLKYPSGDELERKILGVKVYSPDTHSIFRVVGEGLHGFIVNRHSFGQRLLKEALDANVTLIDNTFVSKPIINGGFVRGVEAINVKSGEKIRVESEAVIDASGMSAAIRSKLPPESGIETNVDKTDLIACYREIRRLKSELEDGDFCRIYLNLEVAPGGYYWIFPERGEKVNVGLGVIATPESPNPKRQLYKYVLSSPLFEDSILIHKGGGLVPTRRPLSSIVWNGVIFIGDAACHVNPIHGGGMGPSMIGGRIAGETLTEAMEKGDLGVESLWNANVRYMSSYGAKQAGLDVFRIFLQGLDNEDLNYGMKYRLLREEDVLHVSMGEDVKLNITEATRRVFVGFGKLPLLKKLIKMVSISREVKSLYKDYPKEPRDFPSWKEKVKQIFENAKRSIG